MTTTIGKVSDAASGIYIGRPRAGEPWRWGNPFVIGQLSPRTGKPMNRKEAIDEFELWLATSTDEQAQWMRDNVHKLKNKHLKCFCAPQECHGTVLAKLAEAT